MITYLKKYWVLGIASATVLVVGGITTLLLAQDSSDELDCTWSLSWTSSSSNEILDVNAFFYSSCGALYHLHRDWYKSNFPDDPTYTVAITVQTVIDDLE